MNTCAPMQCARKHSMWRRLRRRCARRASSRSYWQGHVCLCFDAVSVACCTLPVKRCGRRASSHYYWLHGAIVARRSTRRARPAAQTQRNAIRCICVARHGTSRSGACGWHWHWSAHSAAHAAAHALRKTVATWTTAACRQADACCMPYDRAHVRIAERRDEAVQMHDVDQQRAHLAAVGNCSCHYL